MITNIDRMLSKYISVDEYLMGRAKLTDLPDEYIANINTLIPRANELLEAFGEFRHVTSGYRRLEDNTAAGGAKASWHMKCAAVDLEDVDGKLFTFCLNNLSLLKKIGLWLEAKQATPTWLHCQIFPPKSGNRIFLP